MPILKGVGKPSGELEGSDSPMENRLAPIRPRPARCGDRALPKRDRRDAPISSESG